ncbi:hypothetical protein K443DRAFT_676829 [Laccaria amethystina LaAM-08-1]|uniref:Transmembrane protein n=1 Tax=Laccaria amethystina LaAM-08-1 TaxID=1095629 RepID=A0A0C9XPA1_9AGAR|nr:hypothetical protein K443DRAFT_676829 [Laccaria amethystina LaAM-08-1]
MIFGSLTRKHALILQRRLSTSQRSSGAPVHRIPKPEGEDFRPPWVYLMSRLVSFTVIPAVAFYSVFFYDFGDREHVFQPARRWAARLHTSFVTLSPAEEGLIKADDETRDK